MSAVRGHDRDGRQATEMGGNVIEFYGARENRNEAWRPSLLILFYHPLVSALTTVCSSYMLDFRPKIPTPT